MHRKFLPLTFVAFLIGLPAWAHADGPAPPKITEAKPPPPAEVKTLAAFPQQVRLVGADDS